MDEIRPEYLEAVSAARWNGWLGPLFASAPTILAICIIKRWHCAWLVAAVPIAMFITWVSLILYADHIWEAMRAHAVTKAEWREVTSDTGRLYGPILVGIPFAVLYTLVWLPVIAIGVGCLRGVGSLFGGKQSETDEISTSYESYRKSLDAELARQSGKES